MSKVSGSTPRLARVLLDAGPLVAILNANDAQHAACTATLATLRLPLLSCWPVLTEAAYLLGRQGVPTSRMLDLARPGGPIELVPLTAADVAGIDAYLNRYSSLGLQLADASLAHLGDREAIDTLFSLDRRDFGAVVLKSGRSFTLLP